MCVSTSSTSSTTISAIPSTVPRRCCERWSRRGAWAARPVAASMSIAIEAAGLSETQRQIVDLAREFARTRIEPHAAEWDRTAHFARDVLDELGKLGFLGMSTPEEYDGMGLDTLTYLLALEELAAADARVAKGISTFIVPTDAPGYRPGKPEDKMGLRASNTAAIALEDVRLPADQLLGEEGQGFVYAMEGLDVGRLGIAIQAVGIARRALEHSLAYCAERKQFGQPLREFEAVQF